MENENKKFMLDIETLGTKGCPIILQIACCNFDHSKELNLKLCEDTQHLSTTDYDTIKWWEDKEKPVGNMYIKTAFDELREFLKNAKEVWSHDFDYMILMNVVNSYGFKIPYHYRRFRCIRTLISLSKINLHSYNWDEKTHDALDDCKFQIKYCTDAINKLTE